MIAPESTAPDGPASGAPGPEEPLTNLRGAGVQVDVRRAGRVAVGVTLVALAAVTALLFAAGAKKNAQITELRAHGVPVDATVSGCLGLMGGSGSNLAGYDCSATYTVDGHRYTEGIPGNGLRPVGSRIAGVTVPGDPALFSTPAAVAAEHPSASVFVVPTLLLLVLLPLAGVVLARRRRSRRPS
ncbi:MAG: hypothetical protein ACLQPH_00175 [Acidimicrobiales bacterium]